MPVAAALIGAGIEPGAALVFLMTGPATNAATITTVWRMLGRKTATVYLAVVAVSALAAGVVLDLIYTSTGDRVDAISHIMTPAWVKVVSAVVLLGVLAYAQWGRPRS